MQCTNNKFNNQKNLYYCMELVNFIIVLIFLMFYAHQGCTVNIVNIFSNTAVQVILKIL